MLKFLRHFPVVVEVLEIFLPLCMWAPYKVVPYIKRCVVVQLNRGNIVKAVAVEGVSRIKQSHKDSNKPPG